MNFADLARYLWKAADFDAWQNFLEAEKTEQSKGLRSSGVIYGCDVTVNANLTVNIAAGLVLFPSGILVEVSAQTLALNAADVTNPRLDRVELVYSLADGPTVTNIDNQAKVLYRTHVATASKNTGTPAGSPAANTLTVGNLSLAIISVAANQVTLISGNIDQTEDTSRSVSYMVFGSTSIQKIRWNQSKTRFELTEDGAVWMPISRRTYDDVISTISNNQAAPLAIAGLSFDSTKYISATMSVMISIQTDTPTELVEQLTLKAVWRPKTATWDIRASVSDFDDSGVVFSIVTTGTVGQVKYTSGSISGANYVGKLRVNKIDVQAV